jgi:hypothetical protein
MVPLMFCAAMAWTSAPITTHRAGQFGEVSQIDGRASLALAQAGPDGATLLPFDPPHLRALMIGSAEVGEIVMRALILRRVSLIEHGGSGTILIGASDDSHLLRLQGFLTRGGYPNHIMDPRIDGDGRSFVERMALLPTDMPLVVCPGGAVLKRPDERELAACLGILPKIEQRKIYDVAVVGAGPAGLAAAVYGASEGLSVIVLDERTMGGQAGASARIENYLGFPTGISGQALAGRAFTQALKFGAEVAIPVSVGRLDRDGDRLMLGLSDDSTVAARTVVIASGAAYRQPDIAGLRHFEGAGVSYWASPIEALVCRQGNRPCRRRQFGGPGDRVSCSAREAASRIRAARAVGDDVTLPHRSHFCVAQRRHSCRHGSDRTRAPWRDARQRHSSRSRQRGVDAVRNLPSLPVHRRDTAYLLAQRFISDGRQGLHLDWWIDIFARDQHARVFAIGDVRAGSTKQWPPQSVMGLPPFHRSTITSASRPRRRRENL